MANKSFVVKYLIQARDGFSVAAGKVGRSFDKMTSKSKRAERQIAKAGHGIRNTFKRMAAAAIGFFGARAFFDVGIRFQNAMADVSAITGATGKDLSTMREEILRLSKASIMSQDQVANAFKLIASAKSELLKDPKGLSKVAEQVLLLANTGLELETAASVTTQALNQFSAGADQAARFVNILAAGSKVGASEVNETGVAILKTGAVAKAVGITFEQLNAAIQVLAKGGLKAEVAGTGLKTMFLRLERAADKNLRPSVVGLEKALSNLQKKGLSVTQMEKLLGTEAIVVGQILSNNARLVGKWTRELTGTNQAQEQATKRMATFGKQMKLVKVIIDDAIIKTFTRLAPQITTMAQNFGTFLDGIKPEQIDAFASSLGVLLDAAVLIGKAFGKVLGLLTSIGKAIGEVAAATAMMDFKNFSPEASGTLDTITGAAISLVPGGDLLSMLKLAAVSIIGDGESERNSREVKNIGLESMSKLATDSITHRSKVDVGVSVGLDQGLRETAKPVIGGNAPRRTDVGMVAG